MSMTAGSVTVTGLDTSGNPVATSTGAAAALFAALSALKIAANAPPTIPALNSTTTPWSPARPATAADVSGATAARLAYFKDLASTCNGVVSLITYIQAHAEANLASVKANTSGLTAIIPNSSNIGVIPTTPNHTGQSILSPGIDIDLNMTQTSIPLTLTTVPIL